MNIIFADKQTKLLLKHKKFYHKTPVVKLVMRSLIPLAMYPIAEGALSLTAQAPDISEPLTIFTG
jgi:hypothetical protein